MPLLASSRMVFADFSWRSIWKTALTLLSTDISMKNLVLYYLVLPGSFRMDPGRKFDGPAMCEGRASVSQE